MRKQQLTIVVVCLAVGALLWLADGVAARWSETGTVFADGVLWPSSGPDAGFRLLLVIAAATLGLWCARTLRTSTQQAKVAEQQAWLSSQVFRSLDACLHIIDVPTFTIETANHSCCDDDGAGPCCDSLVHSTYEIRSADQHESPLEMVASTGRARTCECLFETSKGNRRLCEVRVEPILDDTGKVVKLVELSRDITQQKQLERRLVQTERQRAIGELTAGICHNLNNMLTGLVAPTYLLESSSDEEVGELLALASSAATQVAGLVRALNQAVRGGEGKVHAVAVNEVVQDAIRSAQKKWHAGDNSPGVPVEMQTKLGEVPDVAGTRWDLEDVLVSLMLNALEAMPSGGILSVASALDGEEVVVTVSDTGRGMDEATRQRVFEPFFTTKAEVGVGLGLASVAGTVNRWGGHVAVHSEPGRGSTFAIRLPRWCAQVAPPPVQQQQRSARQARLLVVDDEVMVRRVLEKTLSEVHQVTTVANGADALACFAPGKYDVVLVDFSMPGMPGNVVAHELRQLDATIALILITGWELTRDDPRADAFDLVIQKPFGDRVELFNGVAEAIAIHDERVKAQDGQGYAGSG